MNKKYVVYYRVSTKRQGESGLGLEAQQAYVHHFYNQEDIVQTFTEIATAKYMDAKTRPLLNEAIKLCKENDYILVVAKVDRLSRNTKHALEIYEYLDGCLESCDIPNLDEFTLTIFMAIATRERKLISIRTKQALDAKREKVGEWRNSTFTKEAWKKGQRNIKHRAAINENNRKAFFTIKQLKGEGLTLRDIAKQLNDNGFRTSKGKFFHPTTVNRFLDKIKG